MNKILKFLLASFTLLFLLLIASPKAVLVYLDEFSRLIDLDAKREQFVMEVVMPRDGEVPIT